MRGLRTGALAVSRLASPGAAGAIPPCLTPVAEGVAAAGAVLLLLSLLLAWRILRRRARAFVTPSPGRPAAPILEPLKRFRCPAFFPSPRRRPDVAVRGLARRGSPQRHDDAGDRVAVSGGAADLVAAGGLGLVGRLVGAPHQLGQALARTKLGDAAADREGR